jgi:hypothetical protein
MAISFFVVADPGLRVFPFPMAALNAADVSGVLHCTIVLHLSITPTRFVTVRYKSADEDFCVHEGTKSLY